MRFLVDAQLPPKLARFLVEQGHAADHVGDLGLLSASDRDIWNYAIETGAILVSKDQDFVFLRASDPSGPSLIWIRLGNTTAQAVIAAFASALPDMVKALEAGETMVELA